MAANGGYCWLHPPAIPTIQNQPLLLDINQWFIESLLELLFDIILNANYSLFFLRQKCCRILWCGYLIVISQKAIKNQATICQSISNMLHPYPRWFMFNHCQAILNITHDQSPPIITAGDCTCPSPPPLCFHMSPKKFPKGVFKNECVQRLPKKARVIPFSF